MVLLYLENLDTLYPHKNAIGLQFDLNIRFVDDFITWCALRPLLFEAGERITARLSSTFGAHGNKHISKMVREVKFDFEERHNLFYSIYRVIFEWMHQKMIIFQGWWSKTLHRHLMSNHSIISARFGLCHVILTTPPGQRSAWKWNFGKTKTSKTAASIFFFQRCKMTRVQRSCHIYLEYPTTSKSRDKWLWQRVILSADSPRQ